MTAPSWTAAKNERRCDLIIRKYSDVGLLPEEADELAMLQSEMIAHRMLVAPLPIREAERCLKQMSGVR